VLKACGPRAKLGDLERDESYSRCTASTFDADQPKLIVALQARQRCVSRILRRAVSKSPKSLNRQIVVRYEDFSFLCAQGKPELLESCPTVRVSVFYYWPCLPQHIKQFNEFLARHSTTHCNVSLATTVRVSKYILDCQNRSMSKTDRCNSHLIRFV